MQMTREPAIQARSALDRLVHVASHCQSSVPAPLTPAMIHPLVSLSMLFKRVVCTKANVVVDVGSRS